MPDNLKRKQPEDPEKININQQWEVDYWCDNLGCSEELLRRAVEKVGPMVSDVKRWLRTNGQSGRKSIWD